MIPLRHTKSELFEIRKRAQQRLCEMLADISAARGTIGAGLTFVFKKFGPVAVMLIERPEHALGDLVATSEISTTGAAAERNRRAVCCELRARLCGRIPERERDSYALGRLTSEPLPGAFVAARETLAKSEQDHHHRCRQKH